jgi:hypothetical protein
MPIYGNLVGATGGGGGIGAKFNFEIVGGTTQPNNPSENTIWVNTENEITGWYFGADDPFIGEIVEDEGAELGSYHMTGFDGMLYYTLTKANSGKTAKMIGAVPSGLDGYYKEYLILLSSDKDACKIFRTGTAGTETVEAENSFVYDGVTYYYSYNDLNNTVETVDSSYTSIENAAMALLDIYNGDGKVWFKTGAKSNASFNALKKNELMVYPVSAYQYINNEFIDVDSVVYQYGQWVELYKWDGTLYDSGNQYVDITGGWKVGEGNATATVNDTEMKLSTSSNSANRIHVETKNKVDLTNYNSIYAQVTINKLSLGSGIANVRCRLGYSSTNGANLANISTKTEQSFTGKCKAILQLDISDVVGEQFVVFGIGYYSVTVTVDKIWME